MTVPEDEIDRRVKQAVQEALAAERRGAAERQANDAQNLARLKREAEFLALEKILQPPPRRGSLHSCYERASPAPCLARLVPPRSPTPF